MKRPSLSDIEYGRRKRTTKRDEFLSIMDNSIPWEEVIAPNRRNRRKTQDGRALRRYCRRWKMERLFAWLQNFRRLVVRYEFHAENFLAMVQPGCIVNLFRYL